MQGKPQRARRIYSLTACFAALLFAAPAYGAVIEGTSRDDILVGTPRADRINAGRGNDFLRGLRGNDTLTGGPGVDDIRAGRGNDWIWAQDGFVDVINCGWGNDDFAVIDSGLDIVRGNCEGVGGLGTP